MLKSGALKEDKSVTAQILPFKRPEKRGQEVWLLQALAIFSDCACASCERVRELLAEDEEKALRFLEGEDV